tara:strand:+ start:588 stop:785 length:198 start_codon:yes stop_codon:yes gene_type:complete
MEELKIYATLPKYGPIPFLKRKEAIKKGFKYYFNGKLCKQNHYCPRLTVIIIAVNVCVWHPTKRM